MNAIDTTNTRDAPTVTVDFDIAVPMRDGARLRAHVYRPGADGPWPTLVTSAPDSGERAHALDPVHAARHGFIVVVEQMRDQVGATDGSTSRRDAQDGYDMVEWAARLPDADGRVVMFGTGQAADRQWQTALAQPPALAGIAPMFADTTRGTDAPAAVTVPTLHVGGWYDVFVQTTLDRYIAMASLGRAARLVVGPWTRDQGLTDPLHGFRADGQATACEAPRHEAGDLSDQHLRWMRQVLTEPADSASSSPIPVRIFVMGRNEWRDETSWPLERARVEPMYLRTGGQLRRDAPLFNGESSGFTCDPADPVPTIGGQSVFTSAVAPGPRDQRPIEARPDVCVFTSEPLQEDLEVTGPVRVVLYAESSAPTTDWGARLCDVHPDGRSFNLCDGIRRVADGANHIRRVEIDLASTSNVFFAGHRLRLQVTSSSLPRWSLNTEDRDDLTGEVAHQRLHHDAYHRSSLELPIVA